MGSSAVVLAMLAASGSDAQTAAPFTGPYVGAAVGAVNHHFVAEEVDGEGNTNRFNVLRWGVGELFGGYDLAVAPRLRLGGEAQFEFGGRSAVERNDSYEFGFEPRYGYSLTGRVGYLLGSRTMAYAGAGYGEHRYRTIASGNVEPAAFHSLDRTRSFVLRAGVETLIAPRVAARLEFEHLDGSRNQVMIGVPFRF